MSAHLIRVVPDERYPQDFVVFRSDLIVAVDVEATFDTASGRAGVELRVVTAGPEWRFRVTDAQAEEFVAAWLADVEGHDEPGLAPPDSFVDEHEERRCAACMHLTVNHLPPVYARCGHAGCECNLAF